MPKTCSLVRTSTKLNANYSKKSICSINKMVLFVSLRQKLL